MPLIESCLGESFKERALKLKERAEKLERAFNTVRYIYNKKNLSVNTKIKHYATVIIPLVLYSSQTLTMNKEKKNLARIERRALRMIYGPVKTEDGYRRRPTSEIYRISELIDSAIIRRKLKLKTNLRIISYELLPKIKINLLTCSRAAHMQSKTSLWNGREK